MKNKKVFGRLVLLGIMVFALLVIMGCANKNGSVVRSDVTYQTDVTSTNLERISDTRPPLAAPQTVAPEVVKVIHLVCEYEQN